MLSFAFSYEKRIRLRCQCSGKQILKMTEQTLWFMKLLEAERIGEEQDQDIAQLWPPGVVFVVETPHTSFPLSRVFSIPYYDYDSDSDSDRTGVAGLCPNSIKYSWLSAWIMTRRFEMFAGCLLVDMTMEVRCGFGFPSECEYGGGYWRLASSILLWEAKRA